MESDRYHELHGKGLYVDCAICTAQYEYERERELELAYELEQERRIAEHERFLGSPEADHLFENGRGE